jgi:hypothetical protein
MLEESAQRMISVQNYFARWRVAPNRRIKLNASIRNSPQGLAQCGVKLCHVCSPHGVFMLAIKWLGE